MGVSSLEVYGVLNRTLYFSLLGSLFLYPKLPDHSFFVFLVVSNSLGSLVTYILGKRLLNIAKYLSALSVFTSLVYIPYSLVLASFGLGLLNPLIPLVALERERVREVYSSFAFGFVLASSIVYFHAVILAIILSSVISIFFPEPGEVGGGLGSIHFDRELYLLIGLDTGMSSMFSLVINYLGPSLPYFTPILFLSIGISRLVLDLSLLPATVLAVVSFIATFFEFFYGLGIFVTLTLTLLFGIFYAQLHPRVLKESVRRGDRMFRGNAVFIGDLLGNSIFPPLASRIGLPISIISASLITLTALWLIALNSKKLKLQALAKDKALHNP